eukprot:1161705-Pelagomonas_calceolata.AAC.5
MLWSSRFTGLPQLQGKKVTALLTHIDWEPQDWTDSPGASDYKGLQGFTMVAYSPRLWLIGR